ncbi:hypothetical protein BDQ17DRAFT_1368608 [Cyathus striatus]|nr:hypothetical protein BDQ17DRAFT_1368608 [Cyathus striatus]
MVHTANFKVLCCLLYANCLMNSSAIYLPTRATIPLKLRALAQAVSGTYNKSACAGGMYCSIFSRYGAISRWIFFRIRKNLDTLLSFGEFSHA